MLIDQFRVTVRPDAVAIFPLEGRFEHPVRIELVVLSGDLDPEILISNQAGDTLAEVNSGAIGQPEVIGQFIFPGSGYYELGVASVTGSGEVGVSVYQLDQPDLQGGGVLDEIDTEILGNMVRPGSYHTFRIQLERGVRIDIIAEALSEGLDLLFKLYAPDGAMVAARDDNVGVNPVLWNYMPDQEGLYTLVLGNFDEHVGEYRLDVRHSESGGQAVIGSRASLELQGSPRLSTWLTLDGKALDGIMVEARPLDSGIDIVLTVTDPFGNVLVDVNEGKVDEPESITLAMLPFDGEYQIEFQTLEEGGEIDYLVRSIRGPDIEMGGNVTPGRKRHEGEVTGAGTVIAYRFEVAAESLIGIDLHATGAKDLDLGFTLYGPDGVQVLEADDVVGIDPIVDRIELRVGGRYVLVVWNFGKTTGTFDLFITNPDAPIEPPGS